MTSSYSSDLKLELMVTGENAGTWGDKTNTNLNLVQQAIAGFEQVTLSSGGTLALVMSDGALSNARNLVIKFATASIAASTICTIPDSIEKFYIFDCTALTNPSNLTIKTASGTGFSPDRAAIFAAYSDGTNLNEVSLDTLGGTVAAANLSGTIATAQIADDAVTFAKMQHTTTDNRVLGAASAGAIGEVQVATDMIADDAVTADKLANTSVSAGSYTASNITVDAQGRITAASSGAGAANMKYHYFKSGPASGNITAPSSVTKTQAFMWGGGGGGGGGDNNPNENAASGGSGGFGYFLGPVSGPASLAFSVASGGNGANNQRGTGNAGGASNFHNFTSNGGAGGSFPASGSSGSAPGSFSFPVNSEIFFTNVSAGSGGAGGRGGSPVAGSPGGPGALIVLFNDG